MKKSKKSNQKEQLQKIAKELRTSAVQIKEIYVPEIGSIDLKQLPVK